MRIEAAVPDPGFKVNPRKAPISISRWVNESPPPLRDLLSAHDVAQLTRRPIWLLAGLSLVGRFPKKLKFRGRGIGWRRSEILDWMSRDLAVVQQSACGPGSRKPPRQGRLPLDAGNPLTPRRRCAPKRPATVCRTHPTDPR